MIAILARIGAALSPLAGLIPWLGPRTGLVVAIAALLGVGGLWAYTEHRQALNAAVEQAVASRDAHWKQKIEEANAEEARDAEEARQEGAAVPPAPERPDGIARLCAKDNLCRGDDES